VDWSAIRRQLIVICAVRVEVGPFVVCCAVTFNQIATPRLTAARGDGPSVG